MRLNRWERFRGPVANGKRSGQPTPSPRTGRACPGRGSRCSCEREPRACSVRRPNSTPLRSGCGRSKCGPEVFSGSPQSNARSAMSCSSGTRSWSSCSPRAATLASFDLALAPNFAIAELRDSFMDRTPSDRDRIRTEYEINPLMRSTHLDHAISAWIGVAFSTPVNFWSRPWYLYVKRLWSIPSSFRIVAWKS